MAGVSDNSESFSTWCDSFIGSGDASQGTGVDHSKIDIPVSSPATIQQPSHNAASEAPVSGASASAATGQQSPSPASLPQGTPCPAHMSMRRPLCQGPLSVQALASDAAELGTSTFCGEGEGQPYHVDGSQHGYELWLPHIQKFLGPAQAQRGLPKRKLIIASLCGGTSPEHRILDLLGYDFESLFQCDHKMSAYNYCRGNHRAPCHYILDAKAFDPANAAFNPAGATAGLSGRCLVHGDVCSFGEHQSKVDYFAVSISCCPYTRTRTGRTSGTTSHPDSFLIQAFYHCMTTMLPRCASFEQVWGFSTAESLEERRSPLQLFLQRCRQELPQYETCGFGMTGTAFLAFPRHRVFVLLLHKDFGGLDSLRKTRTLIRVRFKNAARCYNTCVRCSCLGLVIVTGDHCRAS